MYLPSLIDRAAGASAEDKRNGLADGVDSADAIASTHAQQQANSPANDPNLCTVRAGGHEVSRPRPVA